MATKHPLSAPWKIERSDALIIVDVQNDFLPGGSLAVPYGDKVVEPLNAYVDRFVTQGRSVYASRDWHPAGHCSFAAQGGEWPTHCLAHTHGAAFAAALRLPNGVEIISKAIHLKQDAYSAFEGTGLAEKLRAASIQRLFIGGLATDYCVLNTVKDALAERFTVHLLIDAIRAVNKRPRDGKKALDEMLELGASPVTLEGFL